MSESRGRAWPGRVGRLVGYLLLVLILSVLSTVNVPAQYKLTAPVVCPETLSEPFVLMYAVGDDGISYTMYCAGGRGEREEVGLMRPWLTLVPGHLLISAVVVGAFLLVRRYRRKRLGAR